MKNGTCWLDDQGKLIQAHGGMIIKFGDLYYWYGENKGRCDRRELLHQFRSAYLAL